MSAPEDAPQARPEPEPARRTRPTRVLYLGGLGRSGTTLLERLLGELPGAVSLGEVVHLWERCVVDGERCGCGVPFRECPFWAQVGELAFGGWDRVDVERLRSLKQAADRTRYIPALARRELPAELHTRLSAYLDHYTRLYRAVQRASGAEVVIDSSKHAALAFCLRWAAHAGTGELDLRVIHVVRDSRGVAYSWTKQVRRPEGLSAPGEFMAQWSPAKTAVHWNAENAAFALLARRGTTTTRLRYEEFLRAPAEALRQCAEFAGLTVDDAALAFLTENAGVVSARLSATHTASGNPMRFQTGPIQLRRDETWRTRLAAQDRRTVTALTLPLLRHYGYIRSQVRGGPA
jgi:sulfotransferase family protein